MEIDIFERQHVGGRLAPITISGQNYNAGGSFIHPANMYMVNFTEMLGKNINQISDDLEGSSSTGISVSSRIIQEFPD